MDKEDVVYMYSGVLLTIKVYSLLSHKKEQNDAICNNVDVTWDYHTK